MTLCRKCGKEIPDGEELCEDCKNKESQMDEAYLEELMQNMSDEEKEPEMQVNRHPLWTNRWRRNRQKRNRQKKFLMEKRM